VRSTSWICPGDRPGKASNDRVGEGLRAQRPIMSDIRGNVRIPRSLSVVSKVWSL
jgi:hypothetical protein